MGLRSKSRTRLILLTAACVGTATLIGGAYGFRKWQRAKSIMESKPKGLEAYKKGEFIEALNLLQGYVAVHDDDLEALEVYVKVREKLPEPDGGHLQRVMPSYRRLAALKPGNLEVKQALVKLYWQLGMNTETAQGVDDIIQQLVTEVNGPIAKTGTSASRPSLPSADTALMQAIATIKQRQKAGDADVQKKFIDPLVEALQMKVGGEARLHRMKEADQTADALLSLDQRAESIQTKLDAMQVNQESREVIFAKMLELVKGRENDLDTAIMVARMYLRNADRDNAAKWALAADKLELTSDQAVLLLVDLLERLDKPELFVEARNLLDKGRAKFKSDELDDAYYARLIFLEQYEKAADEIAKLVDTTKRPYTMGMRLVALCEQSKVLQAAGQKAEADKKKEEAKSVMKAIGECAARWDTLAQGWQEVLNGVYFSDMPQDRQLIEACRSAASRDPANPFFYAFWGDAYRTSGDSSAAMQQWRVASAAAPSWGKPLTRASRYYAAAGDPIQALQLARMANDRLPDRKETIAAVIISWHGALVGGAFQTPEKEAKDLLKFAADHKAVLGFDENTVPLEVLLIQQVETKEAAVARIREVIAGVNKDDSRVLLSLAVVSHQQGLGSGTVLEDECLAKFESLAGITSDLATTRCRILLDDMALQQSTVATQNAGTAVNTAPKITAAMIKNSFAESKSKAGKLSTADQEKWEVAECQLLDVLRDSAAHDQWKTVSAQRSESVSVQWAALAAPSVRADHNMTGQILERLKALNGDTGLTWRLEKGQWLLEDQSSRDSLEQAAKLLTLTVASAPDSVAARKLLARGYELTGNMNNALAELNRAAELDSLDLDLKLDLAAMYERQNDPGRAMDQLTRVTSSKYANDTQRIRAGGLLAQAGDPAGAQKILGSVQGKSPAVQQMMPALYWQQGDLVSAYDGYLGLVGLTRPKDLRGDFIDGPLQVIPDAKTTSEMIEQALPFFASTNHDEAATLSLQKLEKLEASDAQKHAIKGSYLATTKKWDEAIKELDAAVKLDPKNGNYWRRLIATLITAERLPEAQKAANEAKPALPADVTLASMERLAASKDALKDPDLQVYLVAGILSANQARGMPDVVTNLTAADMVAPVLAHKIRLVADRNTESVALQVFAIRKLMTAGLLDEATMVAQRAMVNDATAPQPALLATLCLAQQGKWDEALVAAKKWKLLAAGSANPDMVIAASYIKLARSSEAVNMLQQYIGRMDDKAAADPQNHGIIMLFASAQLQQGQTAEAEKLVWGLVEKDKSWREDWTFLATEHMKTTDLSVAEKWLNKLSDITAPDDLDGQMIVAMGWFRLGKNFNYPDAINKGTMQAQKITQVATGDVKKRAVAAMLFGSLREQQGDALMAKSNYQRALELDPGLYFAANNLAMIVSKEGDSKEAERLARQAIASVPAGQAESAKVPFYDTLATVLSAAKNYPGALDAIDTAIKMDPRNPLWIMNKAEICVAAGRTDLARAALQQFDALQVDLTKAPELKRRYDLTNAAARMKTGASSSSMPAAAAP